MTSQSEHGTCYDTILFRATDSSNRTTLDPNNWQGVDIDDDDVVVSHGDSILDSGGRRQDGLQTDQHHDGFFHWFLFVTLAAFAIV
jgi:hypothetical protein